MLRQRLVRQGAVSIHSSSESTNMPSPPPIRKRRGSQDAKMYKQLSSESMDNLLMTSPSSSNSDGKRGGGRRHSVACGVLHVDMQKPNLKSAFNSAVRRMSDACSMLSSAPSSTYNLSSQTQTQSVRKKEGEVILPQVLGTFRQNFTPKPTEKARKGTFQFNRRFSTDCPPPSYTEAVTDWKQSTSRQKLLSRQKEVVSSKSSLVAVEDGDCGNIDE